MELPEQPRHRPDLVTRELDGDFVVYDPQSDQTALLNPTAALVFELCDGSRTCAEIADAVSEAFGAQEARVRGDVERAVGEMLAAGLLEGSEDRPSDPLR